MFLLNSCLELDIAAHRALFLPKLQSYFAEFLKEGSLALRGYSLPAYLCRFKVQVIITYGIASFSWKYDINYFDF